MTAAELFAIPALLLSIINGLFLLKFYLRDRPKIKIQTNYPDLYSCWFKLSPGEYKGRPTRKYGLLFNTVIINKGLRKTSLKSWNFFIKTLTSVGSIREVELRPMLTPELNDNSSDRNHIKLTPLLGQKEPFSFDDLVIRSGVRVTTTGYYIAEFYGELAGDPLIDEDEINGRLEIEDVFGKKAHAEITFSKIQFEEIHSLIPNIESFTLGINKLGI